MIKVLIIEDEQPAASRLQKLLAEVAADFEVIHRCDSSNPKRVNMMPLIDIMVSCSPRIMTEHMAVMTGTR